MDSAYYYFRFVRRQLEVLMKLLHLFAFLSLALISLTTKLCGDYRLMDYWSKTMNCAWDTSREIIICHIPELVCPKATGFPPQPTTTAPSNVINTTATAAGPQPLRAPSPYAGGIQNIQLNVLRLMTNTVGDTDDEQCCLKMCEKMSPFLQADCTVEGCFCSSIHENHPNIVNMG